MLSLKWIRENQNILKENLKRRNYDFNLNEIISLDIEWRNSLQQLEKLRHDQKKCEIENAKQIKLQIQNKEKEVLNLKSQLDDHLYSIPNILMNDVPLGKCADDNIEIRQWGKKPKIDHPLHHDDILQKIGCYEKEKAVAISGSRFVILNGILAKFERVLKNWLLEEAIKAEYVEYSVPNLALHQAGKNAAQLPKFENDLFMLNKHFLIPTSEVILVNLIANQVVKDLPLLLTACTACFRKESGSLGKDTKGLIRLHQFEKVELVAVTTQENSEKMHQNMLASIENLLQKLNLHYRVMLLCSEDTGFHSAKTFDVEVWMPGQNRYVEISSCSNCTNFQSRRMKSYYKNNDDKILVHTLNGSALPIGRLLAAILENFQFKDGISVPSVLESMLGHDKIYFS